MPFLTELDSRAAVKGSVDPIGCQAVWTRFGRHVVGNLTTVSSSVRDYTVTLLGMHFAERVADEGGPVAPLETFLKWEQLCGYARAQENDDWSFRGTEKVRRNLDEGDRVTLSADRVHQILTNQKTYGLFGLYTVPSRSSGLLQGTPARLTPPARELVESLYLPILATAAGRDARKLVELLAAPSARVNLKGADLPLVKAVAKVLSRKLSAQEREFYKEHLLHGGPDDQTSGRQRQLAELLTAKLKDDFVLSASGVRALAKEAKRNGEEWHPLASRLDRIGHVEALIGPCSMLFSWLLGCEGLTLAKCAKEMKTSWGDRLDLDPVALQDLHAELGADASATGDRWVAAGRAAAGGKYGELLEVLIAHNGAVMAGRGGTPWVELAGGSLRIRFRDEAGRLPDREELPGLWRFPYFIDSLQRVAATLGGA